MTKVGIIADTHDNIVAADSAIDLFNSRGVELVIHAGDWNAPFTLARFAKSKTRVIGVFGNIDGDRDALLSRAERIGVQILGNLAEVEVGGVKIAVIHGKDERVVEALAKSGTYGIVIRGHTHRPDVRSMGPTLVINPGEACGYLTGKRTIAMLDTDTLGTEIVEI